MLLTHKRKNTVIFNAPIPTMQVKKHRSHNNAANTQKEKSYYQCSDIAQGENIPTKVKTSQPQ